MSKSIRLFHNPGLWLDWSAWRTCHAPSGPPSHSARRSRPRGSRGPGSNSRGVTVDRLDELVEVLKTATGTDLADALAELVRYGPAAFPAVVRSYDQLGRPPALQHELCVWVLAGFGGDYVGRGMRAAERGMLQREAAAYAVAMTEPEARMSVGNLIWAIADDPDQHTGWLTEEGIELVGIAAAVPAVIPEAACALLPPDGYPTTPYRVGGVPAAIERGRPGDGVVRLAGPGGRTLVGVIDGWGLFSVAADTLVREVRGLAGWDP